VPSKVMGRQGVRAAGQGICCGQCISYRSNHVGHPAANPSCRLTVFTAEVQKECPTPTTFLLRVDSPLQAACEVAPVDDVELPVGHARHCVVLEGPPAE
jgi:hypothetical protein